MRLQGTVCAPTVSLSHWQFLFCSSNLWGAAVAPGGVRWSVGGSASGVLGVEGPRVHLLMAGPACASPSVGRDSVQIVVSGGIGVFPVVIVGRAVRGAVCPGSTSGAAVCGCVWVGSAAGWVVREVMRNVLSGCICALSAVVVRGVVVVHVVGCSPAVCGQHMSASLRERVL